MKNFIQRCIDGEDSIDNLGAVISQWYHTSNQFDVRDLHEFIGLTWEEYIKWSKGDALVPYRKYEKLKDQKIESK